MMDACLRPLLEAARVHKDGSWPALLSHGLRSPSGGSVGTWSILHENKVRVRVQALCVSSAQPNRPRRRRGSVRGDGGLIHDMPGSPGPWAVSAPQCPTWWMANQRREWEWERGRRGLRVAILIGPRKLSGRRTGGLREGSFLGLGSHFPSSLLVLAPLTATRPSLKRLRSDASTVSASESETLRWCVQTQTIVMYQRDVSPQRYTQVPRYFV